MTQEELDEYKKKISNLTVNEKKMRDLYLRDLSLGLVQGPLTGYASIDKPWLKNYTEEQISNMFDYSLCFPLYELLDKKCAKYKDFNALKYFKKGIKYSEFQRRGEEIAKGLQSIGVKPGDIVTVCLPCVPEFTYFLYAINKLGAISNWVDFRASKNEITHILETVNSKVIVSFDGVDEKIIDSIRDYTNKGNKIEHLIKVMPSDSIAQPVKTLLKIKERLSRKKDEKIIYLDKLVKMGINERLEAPEFVPNSTAVIVYTGGTTGISKGVELSNENLNALVNNYNNSSVELKEGDSFLHFLPPWTAYGIGIFYLAIANGIETNLIPKLDPATYDKLIIKEMPNYTTGIPKNLEILVNSKAIKESDDLSFFKYVGVGADYLNENLEKQTVDFLEQHKSKAKVSKGYGLTEACATFATCSNTINRIKSVGIPFASNNISIESIGEDGKEVNYNELGEICLSGPSIMKGYYKDEGATEGVLKKAKDGSIWLHTGDIGKIDEDGFLYITGRIKRMLVRSGFKLFPSEIEDAITSHPSVINCAAVGVKDNLEGQIPVVSILLNDHHSDKEKLSEELDKICRESLYDYYMPITYRFVESLPYTKNGKVDYRQLEEDSTNFIKSNSNSKILTKK